MKLCVFDIEADGLYPTKIHCLTAAVYSEGEWRIKTTTCYDEMRSFFSGCDVVVGHNIIRWDIPNAERLLGMKIEAMKVDTLALSWYLEPTRPAHGLEGWGEDFGVPKPIIDDWENLTVEEYIHRCEEDVKINCNLWDRQIGQLINLYEGEKETWRFIKYLMFKMDCAQKAEESKWRLDVKLCEDSLADLERQKEEKVSELRSALPKTPIYSTMNFPKKPYKIDGTLSTVGKKWEALVKKEGLEDTHVDSIKYIAGYKESNPNSISQVKDWLYTLGWEPITYKYTKKVDENGRRYTDKIAQVREEVKGEKVLCKSVLALSGDNKEILLLEGLTILTHRIGILKAFLKGVDKDGYVTAAIQGLTNTLRFKHKTVVNLPSINKPFGDIVRGVLIAPEGYELCGSDMSSLEDRTKQHYMWDYDPEYVKEMQIPDFDPHLALAEFAEALTPEQVKAHKNKEEDHSRVRHLYKTANYSCTYKIGGKSLGRALKINEKEGNELIEAFNKRNWSLLKIEDNVTTKDCLGKKWLFNPVSKFWYYLKNDRDRFSTLNQGTGVYCFDIWIYNFMKKRPQITGQMHDEVILCIKKGYREECEKLLRDAIDETNKQLKLNRDMDIDVQFGKTYAEIH